MHVMLQKGHKRHIKSGRGLSLRIARMETAQANDSRRPSLEYPRELRLQHIYTSGGNGTLRWFCCSNDRTLAKMSSLVDGVGVDYVS